MSSFEGPDSGGELDASVRMEEGSRGPSESSRHRKSSERHSKEMATDLTNCPLLVHLDLKGAPPNSDYLASLFPKMKKWGCTGLLIEWEDMLPYTGALRCIRNVEHYTKEEVNYILQSAHEAGLQIIPLVQTFGHLEYVLKYPQFAHLREEPDNYMDLCPLSSDSAGNDEQEDDVNLSLDLSGVGARKSKGAAALISDLLSQVIQMHKDANVPLTHVHVGGDEVFSLGNNPLSAAAMAVADGGVSSRFLGHESIGLQQLFLDHICGSVLPVVGDHNLSAMLWHDMLDRCPPHWLKRLQHSAQFDMGSSPCPVEVVVWAYTPDIADSLPADAEGDGKNTMWNRFADAGLPLWGASAFKGAASPDTCFPPVSRHVANHLSWISRAEVTQLQGLVITGWSRFNHTATLCETLPAGLPSLALNLSVFREIGKSFDSNQRRNHSFFFAGSSSSSTMMPLGSYREVVKEVHRRVYKELGLVWNNGNPVPLTPSVSQLADLPWPNDEFADDGDLAKQSFPGGSIWRLFGQLEGARMQFQRAQENRKLFGPPYTHRLNPPLWRRIEQHCRSTASMVASLRDRMITYCARFLSPGSVSEIVHGKINILERECIHVADELARWRAFYCPGNFEHPSATIGPVPPSPSGAPTTPNAEKDENFNYVQSTYTQAPPNHALKDTPPNGSFQFMAGIPVDRCFPEPVVKKAIEFLKKYDVDFDSTRKPCVECSFQQFESLIQKLKNNTCNLASDATQSLRNVEAKAALCLLLPVMNSLPRFTDDSSDQDSATDDVSMQCTMEG